MDNWPDKAHARIHRPDAASSWHAHFNATLPNTKTRMKIDKNQAAALCFSCISTYLGSTDSSLVRNWRWWKYLLRILGQIFYCRILTVTCSLNSCLPHSIYKLVFISVHRLQSSKEHFKTSFSIYLVGGELRV